METTEEPKPIGTEIEQVSSRLLALASSRCESGDPVSKCVAHATTDAKLADRGYPERHRSNLPRMHGPALDKARELLPRVLSGDCLLLLVGDRGPGKTQMATRWAAELIRAGKSPGYYRKTTDLIAEIKQTWHDGGKRIGTEDDVLRKYRRTKFLVLDEFHERGDSDWESRTLINLIDHRYDAMLATVIISNIAASELRTRINPSILSRAEETGGLVNCDWPSYRSAPNDQAQRLPTGGGRGAQKGESNGQQS